MSDFKSAKFRLHEHRPNVSNSCIEQLQLEMDREINEYNSTVTGPLSLDTQARILNDQTDTYQSEAKRLIKSNKTVARYFKVLLLPWRGPSFFPEKERRIRELFIDDLMDHKQTVRVSRIERCSFVVPELYSPAYEPDSVEKGGLRPHDDFEVEIRTLCRKEPFIGTEWRSWYNMSLEVLPNYVLPFAPPGDVFRQPEKKNYRDPNTYETLIGKLARRVIFLYDLALQLPDGDHKNKMKEMITTCRSFIVYITSFLKRIKQHRKLEATVHEEFADQIRRGFSTLFRIFVSMERALKQKKRTPEDEETLLMQVRQREDEVDTLMEKQKALETAHEKNAAQTPPDAVEQPDSFAFEAGVKETLSDIPYKGGTNFETITEKRNAEIASRAKEERKDLEPGELVSELERLEVRRVDLLQAEAEAEQIGHGSNAKIYSYEIAKTKHTVAVKEMKLTRVTPRKLLHHEARIWAKLRHSHVLELDGFAHVGSMENVVLVSNLCPFGDLRDYIYEKHPSKRQKTRLLWQAADAVKYLHNIGIIHGDLRGRNVLVDHNQDAQLCDFGCAKEKDNGSSMHNGSKLSEKRWMAYELLDQPTPAPWREATDEPDYYGVNESTDIYSFGCLMLEGITGEDPYNGVDDDDLLEMKRAKQCPKRPCHSDIDQDLWDVMKKCWNANPHDRGSAADIYEALKNGWPSQRRERPESQ